jgi:hypothetical protein
LSAAEPGFAAEPRRLPVLQDTPPQHAFAEFRGSYGYTAGVAPDGADDPGRALVAVADDVKMRSWQR